jgi:hypothetical protein
LTLGDLVPYVDKDIPKLFLDADGQVNHLCDAILSPFGRSVLGNDVGPISDIDMRQVIKIFLSQS